MGRNYPRQQNQRQNYSNQNAKIAELEATIVKARQLYKELDRTSRAFRKDCEELKLELENQQAMTESYKKLYLDELQKRLDLAESVRRLEESRE